MSLSTNFIVSQDKLEITGALSPSMAGEKITFYTSSIGSPQTKLATAITDSKGQYFHIWNSPPSGIHSISANWSGDNDYNGANSNTFSLVVVPFEILMIGVISVIFLIILIIFMAAIRGKTPEKPESVP